MSSGEYGFPPNEYGQSRATEPGALLPRFLARLIDGIIVGVVAGVLILLTDTASNFWATGLFTGIPLFGYFVAFETLQGWTPGKKLLGLHVRGARAAVKPSLGEAAVRNAFTLLAVVPLIGGLLAFIAMIVIAVTINGSPTKQGKHDELAGGTQVVKQ
jgi:uncharacterized RDD family membrane protein YckC